MYSRHVANLPAFLSPLIPRVSALGSLGPVTGPISAMSISTPPAVPSLCSPSSQPGLFLQHKSECVASLYQTLLCPAQPLPRPQEAVPAPQPATVVFQDPGPPSPGPPSSAAALKQMDGSRHLSPIPADLPHTRPDQAPRLLWAPASSTGDPPSSLPTNHEATMCLSQGPPGWSALGK